MNRTGLVVALSIGALVGVVFGVWPRFDLAISALFFDPRIHDFPINAERWAQYARDVARVLIGVIVAPAFIAPVGKFLLPRRPMLIPGRAALFLPRGMPFHPRANGRTLLWSSDSRVG